MLIGDSEFNCYVRKISAIPLLTDNEEKDLASKWYHHKDIDAAQKLVTAYLRLVAKIVLKYRNYGLPLMDLVSEGNIGLMKAVKNFNPTFGFKVATYALWWIKSAIQEYILRSWSLVKIGTTAAQRKLFFNLRKLKNNILNSQQKSNNDEVISSIARQLSVSEKEVINMDNILSHRDLSLSTKTNDESDTEIHETMESPEQNHELKLMMYQEQENKKKLLEKAMLSLDDRYRKIFIARRLLQKPKTLKELSQKFNISQERIRQIEKRVVEKIKEYIQKHNVMV